MEIFQMALVIVIAYIAVYGIVDRICKCCETCATCNAFGKSIDASKLETIMKQEKK